MAQLDLFDYITGITIGSIAAELATELEKPWKPLIAMIIYGGITIAKALKLEPAQKGGISALFGFSSKVGVSLTFSSAPKTITKYRAFLDHRILRASNFLVCEAKTQLILSD